MSTPVRRSLLALSYTLVRLRRRQPPLVLERLLELLRRRMLLRQLQLHYFLL